MQVEGSGWNLFNVVDLARTIHEAFAARNSTSFAPRKPYYDVTRPHATSAGLTCMLAGITVMTWKLSA